MIGPGWSELLVGTELPPMTCDPFTIEGFVRYAGASGDLSPPHYDFGVARARGWRAPTAAGMLLAGLMATSFTRWLGPENIRRLVVRFHDLAFVGDVVTYRGEVAGRREVTGERFVDLEAAGRRHDGTLLLTGGATFVVPD